MPNDSSKDNHNSSSRKVVRLLDQFLNLCSTKSPYVKNMYGGRSSVGRSSSGPCEDIFDRFRTPGRRRSDDMDAYRSSCSPQTYGTYYSYADDARPAGMLRYRSPPMDHAPCACNCCPHDGVRHPGSRRSSFAGTEDYHTPRPSSRHSSRYAYDPVDSARSSNSYSHSANGRSRSKGAATVIHVYDKTHGSLGRRHGDVFRLTIPENRAIRDVLNTLAPKGSGHKVMVNWSDGSRETLDEHASFRELMRHAISLEIKKKTRVHWH